MSSLSLTRRRYVAATYERCGLEIKQAQRQRLVALCYAHFKAIDGYIKILSLPGPWLHFEHMLIKPQGRTWQPKFTCCENARALFKLMACHIPTRGTRPLKITYAHELSCNVVTNTKDFVCLECDVQDFLFTRPGLYRVIWLDFCNQLTQKMLAALTNIPALLKDGPCLFALTIMLAREDLTITRQIDQEAEGDRMTFLRQLCLKLVPGSVLLHSERYTEHSTPMAHVVVGRGIEAL